MINKKINIILIIIISFIPFIIKRSDYKDITKTIHINSIGINYNKESFEYECYFYIFNSFNVTNAKISSSNIDNLAYVIKTSSNNFNECFNNLYKEVNTYINLTHLKTIILHTSFINNNNLDLFYNYIKHHNFIYYNFYIFTTNNDFNELFNINNFSDVSVHHTIISDPTLNQTYNLVKFNQFVKGILSNNYTLLIPNINVLYDKLYKQSDINKTLELNGYSIICNKSYIDTITSNKCVSLKWLTHLSDSYILVDLYNLYVKNLKFKLKIKNNILIVDYKISVILLNNPYNELLEDIENKLSNLILDEIKNLYYKLLDINIDIYNTNYYKIDKVEFKLKLELN